MNIRRSELFNFLIFNLFISVSFFISLIESQSYFLVPLVILSYFYTGSFVEKKSSIHMMFFSGYTVFLFLPMLMNWYYLDIGFTLFFLSSFIAAFFLFLTRKTKVNYFIDYGSIPKIIFLVLSLLLIVLIFLDQDELVPSFFAFLILLLSLCFKQSKLKNNLIYLSVFISVFMIYSLFSWSGFGRTVLFGWLLLALLQFSYSIEFNVNKYIFGLFPGLAATLLSSRDLLQLKFSGFEYVLNDSAYGPYRLASSFIDKFNENGFDFLGFLDQVIFTIFVFIPRSIWPDKPNGFGFEYTVRHLEDYLIDAKHSIAATLIGEHIYFLGYFGVFTAILIFSFIAFLTNLLYRINGLNGNAILIFSSSMMVLAWGGMTSFSARVALPTIIFLIMFYLLRKFLIGKVNITWGPKK
ncbi:hypothetical protein [Acinetobacter lwoffii]|uniref:hypothetical protein n=1 Tax=Acinetobacter lwoffii TaxID=28090 RepID=UPI0030D31F04